MRSNCRGIPPYRTPLYTQKSNRYPTRHVIYMLCQENRTYGFTITWQKNVMSNGSFCSSGTSVTVSFYFSTFANELEEEGLLSIVRSFSLKIGHSHKDIRQWHVSVRKYQFVRLSRNINALDRLFVTYNDVND